MSTELDVYHRISSRNDAYAIQATKPDTSGRYGYFCQKRELTDKDLLRSLASNSLTIGPYCVDPETQTTRNPLADIDAHTEEEKREAVELTKRAYAALLAEDGLYPYIEASSGKLADGAHIGVICQPVHAGAAIDLFKKVLGRAAIEGIEVFPKQATVEKGKYGNLVKLPWQYNNRTGKRSEIINPVTWEPMERQAAIQYMMDLPDSVIPEVEKEPPRIDILDKCSLCFKTAYEKRVILEHEPGHFFRLYACRELIFHGATDADIHEYFKPQTDYNPDVTQDKIDDLRQTDYNPVPCDKIIKTGFVDETQCHKCNRKQGKGEKRETRTDTPDVDPSKSCKICRFFRGGINDKLEEWARCELDMCFLPVFNLSTCDKWEPKPTKKEKKREEKEKSGSRAIDILNHKHEAEEVKELIEEINKIEKVKPLIQGDEYIYKIYLRGRVLVIPSKHMLASTMFSRRCLEEFDEKPPSDLSKGIIWDLFLRSWKEEGLIEVIEPEIQDDYVYDAVAFLNELRSFNVVSNTDEYKMKRNILVKQGDHHYLPAANARKIKEKLGLKVPHKTLLELISKRYKCGDKSVRVAGVPTQCWELCNAVITDEIINISEKRIEEA